MIASFLWGVEGGEFRLASLDKGKPETIAVETWLFYTALQLPSRPSVPEVQALHRLKSFGRHSVHTVVSCRGRAEKCGYSRQVRGLVEGWILIWVRRYLCVKCGRTMSCLPDWLHGARKNQGMNLAGNR
jgi:hypothetical protein